jgi:hypothetical protein
MVKCAVARILRLLQPAVEAGRKWKASLLRESFRLDARELDHLGPLLGFFGEALAEVGGSTQAVWLLEPASTLRMTRSLSGPLRCDDGRRCEKEGSCEGKNDECQHTRLPSGTMQTRPSRTKLKQISGVTARATKVPAFPWEADPLLIALLKKVPAGAS